MQQISLPIGSFLAAILVLLPLPAHSRARNVATVSLIAWLFVVDMIYGINTTVWANDAIIRAPVWCDITTKIIIGASTALPAATFCICKHLELVASGRTARLSYEEKRRRMLFEALMCFGIPALVMVLHYVVQGHRFDIVESVGCQPATYFSVPAIFIIWVPPLTLSVGTLVYSALALRHFFHHRISFNTHLHSRNSALTTGRWLRLVAMSITEILWGTIFTSLAMYYDISPGLLPYVSWSFVHADFSRIEQIPLILLSDSTIAQLYAFIWVIPASSYIFFLFFGFGDETRKDYHVVYDWIRCTVFRRKQIKEKMWLPSVQFKARIDSVPSKHISILDITQGTLDDQTLPSYSPPATGKEFEFATLEKKAHASDDSITIHEALRYLPHGPSSVTLHTSSSTTHIPLKCEALPSPPPFMSLPLRDSEQALSHAGSNASIEVTITTEVSDMV